MSDKLEVPRRKVRRNWYVGLNPDPVDRSHPDVHDDQLVQDATIKNSVSRKFCCVTAQFIVVRLCMV